MYRYGSKVPRPFIQDKTQTLPFTLLTRFLINKTHIRLYDQESLVCSELARRVDSDIRVTRDRTPESLPRTRKMDPVGGRVDQGGYGLDRTYEEVKSGLGPDFDDSET